MLRLVLFHMCVSIWQCPERELKGHSFVSVAGLCLAQKAVPRKGFGNHWLLMQIHVVSLAVKDSCAEQRLLPRLAGSIWPPAQQPIVQAYQIGNQKCYFLYCALRRTSGVQNGHTHNLWSANDV